MNRQQGLRWRRVSTVALLVSLFVLPIAHSQESSAKDEATGMASNAEMTEIDFAQAVGLLHGAGKSCYALANGLLGDSESATERAEALQEYFEQHQSSVDTCRADCGRASEAAAMADLEDASDASILKRYGKAIAGLCSAAADSANSVQIYGRRVSKASYDVALAESDIERRKGILLGKTKAEAGGSLAQEGDESSEISAIPENGTETKMQEAPPTIEAQPPTPKAAPASEKPNGDAPAPYWDEKRKTEQVQEEKRVEQNRRIQDDRERVRREKREQQEQVQQQAALQEKKDWYALYSSGIQELGPIVGEFRDVIESRTTDPLVPICRKLADQSQLVIDNKAIFQSPIDEVGSLVSSAVRDYRRMATDCLQGRTFKLGERLRTADDKMERVDELLRPYPLVD